MEDIYTIVDKAIDVAFEEQKFHLKFYDFMKSCKTTGVGAKEFNQSSTAKELTDLVDDLSKYIKGGKDGEHQICLLYTSPSPRDWTISRMPSSA